MMGKPTTKERFLANTINGDNGCIHWNRFVDKIGYGHSSMKGKNMRAHRVSYTIHFGEIPKGICVCHKCDNPRCVNPDHLFLGTKADNARDCVKKGRHAKGSKTGSAKLKEEDIPKIIDLYESGISQKKLGKRFHVNQKTICDVIRRRLWKHVQIPALARLEEVRKA